MCEAWNARFEHVPSDPTAQSEPLTAGQEIVAAYETGGTEPWELAAAIDAALIQARREALAEAGRKAALIGATVEIDTAPVEYISGYQDAAQNIFNAIRALAAKEDGTD